MFEPEIQSRPGGGAHGVGNGEGDGGFAPVASLNTLLSSTSNSRMSFVKGFTRRLQHECSAATFPRPLNNAATKGINENMRITLRLLIVVACASGIAAAWAADITVTTSP
jgi:hypothetical protein